MSGQNEEIKFKEYVRKLLDAQTYDFLEERTLFSRNTLEKTLVEFCDIIAEHSQAESCTVNLKLYDPEYIKIIKKVGKALDEKIEVLAVKYKFKMPKESNFCVEEFKQPSEGKDIWNTIKVYCGTKKQKTNKWLKELNRLLEIPYLYDRICKKKLPNNFSEEVMKLKKETDKYRKKQFDKLQPDEQYNVKRLNRHLLKEIYPQATLNIPKYKYDEFKKSRKEFLKSTQTFPYWLHKKGASILVAANKNGPWNCVLDNMEEGQGIANLSTGISKHIYQENIAKIQDRLSIRHTRDLRKIGGADKFVWNNKDWEHVFKNYYGVPIRIHSGGEVVGILKLENKKTDLEINSLDSNIDQGNPPVVTSFIDNIKGKYIGEKIEDLKDLNASLLSLVYLEKDLNSDECKKSGLAIRNLLFITYPEYGIEIKWDTSKNSRYDESSFEKFPEEVQKVCSGSELNKFKYDKVQKTLSFKGSLREAINLRQKLNGCSGENKEKYTNMFDDIVSKAKQNLKAYNTLKPDNGGNDRPPIQLIAKSLDDERKLWNILHKDANNQKILKQRTVDKLYKAVKGFYDAIEKFFPKTDTELGLYDNDNRAFEKKIEKGITSYLKNNSATASPSAEVKSWKTDDNSNHLEGKKKLPDFYFEVTIKGKGKNKIEIPLYIFIPPTPGEIKKGACFPADKEKSGTFLKVNASWFKPNLFPNTTAPQINKAVKAEYNGEYVEYELQGKGNRKKVTDMLLDRLAARIQAFVFAVPVEEFRDDDTLKLSWASFEIGKLIEREISYRANRSKDPIPLTAMEFFRIPISDFSFVDDLRSRRSGLESNQHFLDHHIESLISDMKMRGAIDYTSRVKEYRSTLLRLGERYEGYVRGNIAIWVYLLSIATEQEFKKTNGEADILELLSSFKKKVDSVNPDFNQKHAPVLSKNVREKIIGGMKFSLPPFECDCEKFKDAFERILKNLVNEQYLTNKFDMDNIMDNIDEPTRKELEDLLFRNYDDFAGDSFSLLAQIINQKRHTEFNEFYKSCYELRDILCTSVREIEDDPKYSLIKDVFSKNGEAVHVWRAIMDFIDKNDTETFCKMFDVEEDKCKYLYLGLPGIYKRIRSLHNMLHNQRSVASLDWELGRYDLSGCRANCLFKNQVFAIYEYIWNKGDPFFQYEINKKPFSEFYNDGTQAGKINRLYWLCLRTNVLQEDYNSLQIAALIDPKSSAPGYWGESTYNLKKVRSVLGGLFTKFDNDGAEIYRSYANKRNNIRMAYKDWYGIFNAISSDKIPPEDADKSVWFNSFLFEGVFDLLIFLCDKWIKNKEEDRVYLSKDILLRFGEIIGSLKHIISVGKKHTEAVKKWFRAKNEKFNIAFECNTKTSEKPEGTICKECDEFCGNCESLWKGPGVAGCRIYKKAKDLLDYILINLEGKDEKRKEYDMINAIQKLLDKEKEHFNKLCKKDGYHIPIPLFYLDWDYNKATPCKQCTITNCPSSGTVGKTAENCAIWFFDGIINKLKPNETSKDANDILSIAEYQFLARMLTLIRRGQKSYLFYKQEPPKKTEEEKEKKESEENEKNPGLWLREKENVLNRIKNYILLFDPNVPTSEDGKKKEGEEEAAAECNSEFAGWTAYDLYYYVRSLVPVEIQVRTKLADTFSEQYHDAIYKGHPPLGTEFPRDMLKRIAEKLDNVDVETEIDFEDYIGRYFLLMQKMSEPL